MVEIELRDITKSYGHRVVLKDLDLQIEKGKFSVIIGAPVSGKSVLMRLVMGLEMPDRGEIWLRGTEITKKSAGSRNFGYVPQSFALYPHFRVSDNIAYPLALAKKRGIGTRKRVQEIASRLKIAHLLDKFPSQLSGGEKQRVALARGVIKDSSVFVLDDPLAGLDFKLREQLFVDLREMISEVEGTFIYSTSDPLETLALADEVIVLDNKKIVEAGTLDSLYDSPRNLRTLQLLGFPNANVIWGELSQTICATPLGEFRVNLDMPVRGLKNVRVGFRPEAVRIGELISPSPAIRVSAEVLLQEDLGAETLLYFEAASCHFIAYWSNRTPSPISSGNSEIGIGGADLIVFDAASGERIGQGMDLGTAQEVSHVGATG
jgi:ABC-type sugar transport system ATPase subunit